MGNRLKIPFEYGTWAGLAAFAYFLIIWFTPYSPLAYARYGSMWIPFVVVFLAVWQQGKQFLIEGYTFANAFLTGIVTMIVMGFLKAVLVFIMIQYIDIGLVERSYQDWIRLYELLKPYSTQPELIEQQINTIKNIKEYPSNFDIARSEMDINFLGGIPVSLLAALIFNRKPKHA